MKSLRALLPVRNRVSKPAHRTSGRKLIASVALTSLLSGSLVSLSGCKGQKFDIGPSTGEVVGVVVGAGAVIGVTTAVLIHVSHAHHLVKGCVSSGPNGFEVQTDDKKTWLLSGNTAGIPAGNVVKFHGNKIKQPKHSTGEPKFEVATIRKNYGPCKAVPVTSAALSETEPPSRAE